MFEILAQVFWDDVCVVIYLQNENDTKSLKVRMAAVGGGQIKFFQSSLRGRDIFVLQRKQNLD
jgi:hypothetical protein